MEKIITHIMLMILMVSCSSGSLLSERGLKKLTVVSRDQFLSQVRLGLFKDQILVARSNNSLCERTFPEGTNFKRPVTKAEFVDCLSEYLKFEETKIVYREFYDLKKNDALFKKAQIFLSKEIIEMIDTNYLGMNEPLSGEELAKSLKRLEKMKNN